jgi:hypothetical protein
MRSFLTVLIFVLFAACPLKAQVPPAYQASYNQMMKQQAFNNFQMSMLHMNFYGNGKLADIKFRFKLKMKDSAEKEVKSFLFYDTSLKQTYIQYINKKLHREDRNRNEKIYCNNVVSVMAGGSVFLPGIITDSCWLFETLSGKITVYSIYPEMYMNTSIAAIKLTTGEIEPFDPEKLKLIIIGNEKAMKKYNKKNYFNAIEKFNDAD